ncbi:glycoside hydrolase family 114 protein [Karstenula rhodostoma CBS 690.94]|uniref:alpha-galactosidase n=1 Tax=Karstenula rhodostoma CBS 690.94 TaxID=1392251 RepID=A0A9P4PB93_9PLEO|nr:glycoside hydrolase family 114 protein [Karstenula rhodostoma CBS 690.94]
MRPSLVLALATLASATPLASRQDDRFKPGTVWDIVLQGKDDDDQGATIPLEQLKAAAGTVLDIDLEDNDSTPENTKGWIKELAKTKTVVCYFSAGTYEPWREDAGLFLPADYGRKMEDWDEWWLDLKSANVKSIMEARIKRAADAGCHAIDPDNIDGYVTHQDGYTYDNQVYIDYVRWLSATATQYNLVTGLKNALEISENVLDVVEFAVNEQCHEGTTWDCPDYAPFTQAGKAVFNIEYHDDKNVYCKDPTDPTVNLSTVLKPLGLDVLGGQC